MVQGNFGKKIWKKSLGEKDVFVQKIRSKNIGPKYVLAKKKFARKKLYQKIVVTLKKDFGSPLPEA